MRVTNEAKKPCKLKDKFKLLIDSLRERQNFRDKIHANALELQSSKRSEGEKQLPDIFPVTQKNAESESQTTNEKTSVRDGNALGVNKNSSFVLIEDKEIMDVERKKLEVREEDEDGQECQVIDKRVKGLNPQVGLQCPWNEGRAGTIKNQHRSVNARFTSKTNQLKRDQKQKQKYIKMSNKPSYREQLFPSQTQPPKEKISIRQLDDVEMVKFWNISKKLTETMTYNEYYSFFQKMVEYLSITIQHPIIKKYKNCIYFGQHTPQNGQYQGILYYFDDKVYYGEFVNGTKHGHGVEINFRDSAKYAGIFNGGKKNGYFFVQKNEENYEGVLQHGLYHGQGKLVTHQYIYTGCFEDGKKHGFGEQYHPKTGLKLVGYFKNDVYQHLNETQPRVLIAQRQLQNKIDRRMTASKSEMIDFKIDLTTKLLKNVRNPSQQEFGSVKHGQTVVVNQVPFEEADTSSLSDLLSNNRKAVKYDFDAQRITQRLPKIYLQGIKKSEMIDTDNNVIVNKHSRALNEQNSLGSRKYGSYERKPLNFQPRDRELNDELEIPMVRRKGR